MMHSYFKVICIALILIGCNCDGRERSTRTSRYRGRNRRNTTNPLDIGVETISSAAPNSIEPPTTTSIPTTSSVPPPVPDITSIPPTPSPPSTPILPLYQCPNGTFDCGNGQCVNILSRCNNFNDCDNHQDEQGCSLVTDVKKCSPASFKCDSGKCVSLTYICDGDRDCGLLSDGSVDLSDENSLRCRIKSGTASRCTPAQFRCRQPVPLGWTRTSHCIPLEKLCDTHPDCPDGSDEIPSFCIYANNCPENHNCSQKCTLYRNQPVCSCETGYELNPDNVSCSDVNECSSVLDRCTHECINTPGSYRCECAEGYELMVSNDESGNATCRAIGSEASFIFLVPSNLYSVYTSAKYYTLIVIGYKSKMSHARINIHQNHQSPSQAQNGGRVGSYYEDLGYDAAGMSISWLDSARQRISVYSMKTQQIHYLAVKYPFGLPSVRKEMSQKLINRGHNQRPILRLEHMRWNWITSQWYLILNGNQITVCNEPPNLPAEAMFEQDSEVEPRLDNAQCTTVLDTGSELSISSLALAPPDGYLFWATRGLMGHEGEIIRSTMDGWHETRMYTRCHLPYSLTVELAVKRIYWADRALNYLISTDYEGENERTLPVHTIKHPVILRVFEDSIYLIQNTSTPLVKINKRDLTKREYLHDYSINAAPVAMELAHKSLQPQKISPCYNINCHQMCLMHNSTHYTCACQWGYEWEEEPSDGKPWESLRCTRVTNHMNGSMAEDADYLEVPGFVPNHCHTGYCQNNGTCMPGLSGQPQCLCTSGFKGEHCEIVESTSRPSSPTILSSLPVCANGGIWLPFSRRCLCTRFYSGIHCEVRLDSSHSPSNTSDIFYPDMIFPLFTDEDDDYHPFSNGNDLGSGSNRRDAAGSEAKAVVSQDTGSSMGWLVGLLLLVILILSVGLVWSLMQGSGRRDGWARSLPSLSRSTASMAPLDMHPIE